MKQYIEFDLSKEDAEEIWADPTVMRLTIPEYVKSFILVSEEYWIKTNKQIFIN